MSPFFIAVIISVTCHGEEIDSMGIYNRIWNGDFGDIMNPARLMLEPIRFLINESWFFPD
jgi:hypothetical protein